MHAIAATLADLFLSPLNCILIIIVVQFFVRAQRTKKICRLTALAIFILFSNQWLFNTYARIWDVPQRDVTHDSTYSCAIVLGGFASPDLDGNGYFNQSADRFIQAVKLYKMGKAKHIIISGGNGKKGYAGFGEGKWVGGQMKIFGVPADSIFYEDHSDNTVDNALNVKRLLDTNHLPPPYILITSTAHIRRAAQIFKNAGIPVTRYPCNYVEGMGHLQWWETIVPDPKVLIQWNAYLRETIGYFAYRIKG